MLARTREVLRSADDGASVVEYGLLSAAIAAVIVVVVFALGGVVRDAFSGSCDAIRAGTPTEAACVEDPAPGGDEG